MANAARFLVLDATTGSQPILLHDWLPDTASVILKNPAEFPLEIIVVRMGPSNVPEWSSRYSIPPKEKVTVFYRRVEPYMEPPRESINALYERMHPRE